MSESEAREILKAPRFGDQICLDALKRLKEIEECDTLRKRLLGKKIECWCCEGSGELQCKCGCLGHECPTCRGDEKLTLTADILADMHLYQLRDIADGK